MKKSHMLSIVYASFITFGTASTNAALIDRGGGLIYDDMMDITWMEDGNYANDVGMTWTEANTWAENLVFGGFDDWRLPSTPNVDLTCGTDHQSQGFLTLTPCSGGELGRLHYEEANFQATGGGFGTLDVFDNVYGGGYWTSELYDWTGQDYEHPDDFEATDEIPRPRTDRDGYAWLFYFGGNPGAHKTILKLGNSRAAWAVRDGDVISAVPLPAAAWLFGTAMIGMIGFSTRRKVA